MVAVRTRYGMRRDYESLYVLAVAFTRLRGGGADARERIHGRLRRRPHHRVCSTSSSATASSDYGEATAEMLLLFAFVAFGTSLIWTGLEVMTVRGVTFALVAVLGRSVVLAATLPRTGLDRGSCRIITWFGPRALSSLLLVLLPVFARVPGAEALVPYVALAVFFSVAIHGVMLWVFSQRYGGSSDGRTGGSADRRIGGGTDNEEGLRISLEELGRLEAEGEPVRILDVRTERAWNAADDQLAGAIRLDPEHPVESAAEQALPKNDWLVGYCA